MAADNMTEPLSRRQRQVYEIICERGLGDKDLAVALGILPKTANFHRMRVLRKMGHSKTSEMIASYWRTKIADIPAIPEARHILDQATNMITSHLGHVSTIDIALLIGGINNWKKRWSPDAASLSERLP